MSGGECDGIEGSQRGLPGRGVRAGFNTINTICSAPLKARGAVSGPVLSLCCQHSFCHPEELGRRGLGVGSGHV